MQDYLGGEIVNSNVTIEAKSENGVNYKRKEVSHYFNLIDNEEIDLTRSQFGKSTIIPRGKPKTKNFETTRDYILSYEPTVERYKLLKSRVEQRFKDWKKILEEFMG